MPSERTIRLSAYARTLLPKFLAARREDVACMRDALTKDDYDDVQLRAHRIRGNGASYGFPELSALGAALESAAVARDVVAVRAGLDALEAVVAEASARLPD